VTLVRNVPVYREVAKSDRLRQYLGLEADVRIALYQGYLQPDRGLDRLVRAAAFLEPKTVIVMMGKPYGTTKTQLEALIAAEKVTDRVKIIPAVPYTELLEWTASADIGLIILPLDFSQAVRNMLPNKLFEYLMVGLPVLASSGAAIADVIETYDVGQVVSSLEPADVGAAINRLLADTIARTRMQQNALEAARREFYWEKERIKLIQLYRDILEMPGVEGEA
jgi:glycosyltransferase involved in cell wall biosynthesis